MRMGECAELTGANLVAQRGENEGIQESGKNAVRHSEL
jgi:hypothetical protein